MGELMDASARAAHEAEISADKLYTVTKSEF
jgi:hypothetical protein